jgi:hypothetical protein
MDLPEIQSTADLGLDRIFQRRFTILLEAVLILTPFLRANPSIAQQIRNAVFKIQSAQAYPYANRDYDEDGIISQGIEELAQLANELKLGVPDDSENHDGQVSPSAKELSADDAN